MASGSVILPQEGATLVTNATCPAGSIALGGGGSVIDASPTQGVMLDQSQPTGNPPSGWRVRALQTDAGGTEWSLVAYVICSDLPDGGSTTTTTTTSTSLPAS